MGTTLKLTNRAVLKLYDALTSLDGTKEKKDEMVIFEFARGVSWNLSKNTVIVERAKLTIDKEIRKLALGFGIKPGESVMVGGSKEPDEAKLSKFLKHQEAVEELKDLESTLDGIVCITLDELLNRPANGDGKVLTNLIPQSVRNGLVPIIKEATS